MRMPRATEYSSRPHSSPIIRPQKQISQSSGVRALLYLAALSSAGCFGQVGYGEALVIVALVFILFGPWFIKRAYRQADAAIEKLPNAMGALGKGVGQASRWVRRQGQKIDGAVNKNIKQIPDVARELGKGTGEAVRAVSTLRNDLIKPLSKD